MPDDSDDPMEIVNRTDTAYEERLDLLQARLADCPEADEEGRARIKEAIEALETGARFQGDGPDAGTTHGYGAAEKGPRES